MDFTLVHDEVNAPQNDAVFSVDVQITEFEKRSGHPSRLPATPSGRTRPLVWTDTLMLEHHQLNSGESTLDILCCIKGKFVAIEAKVPGNKPTARQRQTIMAIEAAGGIAFWADSLDMVKSELKARGI